MDGTLELYFSPLACSLASRIALYEAGANARFTEVDPRTKRTLAGDDYLSIYALGMVPLLRLENGSLLPEGAAILQYIANRYPDSGLAPRIVFEHEVELTGETRVVDHTRPLHADVEVLPGG